MLCRAIRGAITVEENSPQAIREATKELMEELITKNQLTSEDIVCLLFTTTPDLDAYFPASAVREELNWDNIPMLCSHEINVPGSLPRCIRVMVLINTEKKPEELCHIYLRGAEVLKRKGGL